MKVSLELSKEYDPPYAVIYTDAVTDEIQRAVDTLGGNDTPLIAQHGEQMVIIKPEDVRMIRVEGGDTVIYTGKEKYYSGKRLYEVYEQLGAGFMQISKQTVICLSRIKSVEAGFSGNMLLKLDNGLEDYVSRKYLPGFRKYLGL